MSIGITNQKINQFITFANYLADVSTPIARKYFRKNFAEEKKANDTPVTLADKKIEEEIRKAIQVQFPDHGIIGEEFENINSESDYKWIIDPIDGTASFIIGRPIFGTLICLSYKNKPIIGIINQPITDERWVGVIDKYSKFNDHDLKTRNCKNISDAILCTTSPEFFKGKDLKIFKSIASKTKYQEYGGVIYGGDCYLFGLLALGFVDIIIECGLKNYDYMALIPIIEEAGGIVTDWNGKKMNLNSDGTILACGNKRIHKKVLEFINNS